MDAEVTLFTLANPESSLRFNTYFCVWTWQWIWSQWSFFLSFLGFEDPT